MAVEKVSKSARAALQSLWRRRFGVPNRSDVSGQLCVLEVDCECFVL